MLQRSRFLALAAAVCLGPIGCSKSDSTAKLTPENDSSVEVTKPTDINSVNAISGEGEGLSSPAKQQTTPSVDPRTDPATVTSKYLGYLKEAANNTDGNIEGLIAASNLLTVEAREATREANVDLKFPGPDDANYIVHQAKYVTSEKNIAHVQTTWKGSDGDDYDYDVTWVLKANSVGWRISGMITNGETAGELVVFNFEDVADITNKGAEIAEAETQVAGKGDGTIR